MGQGSVESRSRLLQCFTPKCTLCATGDLGFTLLVFAVELLARSSPYLAQAGGSDCAYGRAVAVGKPSWIMLVDACSEWEKPCEAPSGYKAGCECIAKCLLFVCYSRSGLTLFNVGMCNKVVRIDWSEVTCSGYQESW